MSALCQKRHLAATTNRAQNPNGFKLLDPSSHSRSLLMVVKTKALGASMREIILSGGLILACLVPSSSGASAEWKLGEGRKAFSSFAPITGTLATVPAKAPSQGVTARLQLECFTHPELSGLYFGVILSKETTPGFMGWRFQYDDGPVVERKPSPRLSLTNTALGDRSSDELKGLLKAKRLRLTLLPPRSPDLKYEFDVLGAEKAAAALGCKELNSMR